MSIALDEMSTALVEAETAVERWNVDRTRTTVEFEVKHLWGLHTVRGRFRSFDGAYIVGPGGSEIELTIDAASIDTGVAKRDEHLRSPTSSSSPCIRRCGSGRLASPDWETETCT